MPEPVTDRRPGSTLLSPVHRGREAMLQAHLTSLAAAQPSAMSPVEVLVITQDLPHIGALLHAALPHFPFPLRTAVFPQATTLSQLRNAGLRAVTTAWVHCADSDTVFPPDYFVHLERVMVCAPRMSPASNSILRPCLAALVGRATKPRSISASWHVTSVPRGYGAATA